VVCATERCSIAAFYFAYFAAMGLLLPFFPLWLQGRGLSEGAIGAVLALLAVAKVLAPPVFGTWLDGQRACASSIIAAASALAALCVLGWPWLSSSFGALAAGVFAFGALWAAILPAVDHLAFAAHEGGRLDYARLRLWGSLGFVAASIGAGIWFSRAGIDALPALVAAMLAACALASWVLPVPKQGLGPASGALPRNGLAPLLLLGFLMQASHGAYYGFFSLRLAKAGWSSAAIGAWWVLGVLAEIALMALWGARIQRLPVRNVFAACFALAALRWAGLALSADAVWLVPLQLLHAASFAAFHLAGIAAVQRTASGAGAQGWYSAAGFGRGVTLGTAASGAIAQRFGLEAAFAAASAIALLGLGATWRMQR